MRDHRDVGVIVLVLLGIICLTIFSLKVTEPGGALVELLSPRV